jgi:hypothetical protein
MVALRQLQAKRTGSTDRGWLGYSCSPSATSIKVAVAGRVLRGLDPDQWRARQAL